MIFVWAVTGWPFIIGLVALLGGLYAFYRFLVDEGGKVAWYIILTAFTVFHIPMTLPGDMGGGGAHDWIGLIGIFAGVSLVYWFLPLGISIALEKLRSRKDKASAETNIR